MKYNSLCIFTRKGFARKWYTRYPPLDDLLLNILSRWVICVLAGLPYEVKIMLTKELSKQLISTYTNRDFKGDYSYDIMIIDEIYKDSNFIFCLISLYYLAAILYSERVTTYHLWSISYNYMHACVCRNLYTSLGLYLNYVILVIHQEQKRNKYIYTITTLMRCLCGMPSLLWNVYVVVVLLLFLWCF